MTPEAWFATTDPYPLLEFLTSGSASVPRDAAIRLNWFVEACNRLMVRRPVTSGGPVAMQRDAIAPGPIEIARDIAKEVASRAAGPVPSGQRVPQWHDAWNSAYWAVRATQAGIIRDLFPPPGFVFRRDGSWLSSTVVAMVRGMVKTGDYSAMPILADALQDAGCEDEAILNHCRDARQVHAHRCWVVDLVLGKA